MAIPNSSDILQAVIEATPDAIFVKDLEGRYVLVNQAAARFLGLSPADIVGKHDLELYPEETARRFMADDQRVLALGEPQAFEGVATSPFGVQAYLVTKGVYRDPDDAILGIYGISHDITELRRAQETLEQTRAALFQSQKMEAVGQLTGGIAHDFNNLVAVILGNLQLLRPYLPADPMAQELVEEAARAASHGQDLTSDLLAFSGGRKLSPRPVNVNALVTRMSRLLTRTLGRAIEVMTFTGHDAGMAFVDPSALESAMLNVALNARDAMPQGGPLTIRTAATDITEAPVIEGDLKPGRYATLSIEDTGTGMPPDVLGRIFEPFFTTKPSGRGTGLGLSMVYGFARQSGGTVTAESAPGRGTTVRIFLPAVKAAIAAALLFASSLASAQPSAAPLTLEAAVTRALAANRELAAARLEGPVAQAVVDIARERPNPDVTYEREKETPRQSLAASLPIEIGGKRGRRVDLAQAGLGVYEAGLAQLSMDLRTRVRRAFFALVAANRRARLADDLRALAQRARDAAQARFDAGDVPRLEVVQTELALVDTENVAAGARGDIGAATAGLNVLLAQAPDAPLDVAEPAALAALPTLAQAQALAAGSSVELALVDRRLAEQAARRGLAQALRTPDLTAGASYTFDAQPEFAHGYRASAGITVPLFTRHTAAVVLEDAAFAQLTATRDAMVATIAGQVAAALARAAAAREQVERSERESLPRAAEVERMAQDAYSSGQTGLVALLQALQFTRDVRQRALDQSVQYHEALADLERAIGAPLP